MVQGYFYIAASLAKFKRSLLSRLVTVQRICSLHYAWDKRNGPQRFKKFFYGNLRGLQNATLLRGELQIMLQHAECAEALNSLKFNLYFVCGLHTSKPPSVICHILRSVPLRTFQTSFPILPILFSEIIVSGGTQTS